MHFVEQNLKAGVKQLNTGFLHSQFVYNFYLQKKSKRHFFAPLMKQLLAILLLLTIAFYVLPVSHGLKFEEETACKCADNNETDKSEEGKKETVKEFIASQPVLLARAICTKSVMLTNVQGNIPVHHTVETPPPDQA
jgi:hypothetical protein